MNISKSTLEFLTNLSQHNERDWFSKNKGIYQSEFEQFKFFCDELLLKMETFDLLEGKNVFRIYRDVRFSKDKQPYKTHFSVGFTRATKYRRGGYYLHIQPGESFIGGGFWSPEQADLKRIRQELATDVNTIIGITQTKDFIHYFGEVQGEKLKSAPNFYPKDHENVEWLKFKQFLLIRKCTDKQVLADDFLAEVAITFKQMLPFLNYFSEVLTTDENGSPLPGF